MRYSHITIIAAALLFIGGCGSIADEAPRPVAREFDYEKIVSEVSIQAPAGFSGGVKIGKGGLYYFSQRVDGVHHQAALRVSETESQHSEITINGRVWKSSNTLYQGACYSDYYTTPYEDYFLQAEFHSCPDLDIDDIVYTGEERFEEIIKPTLESFTITEPTVMRTLPDHKDLAAEFTQAVLKTNQGDIVVEFHTEKSPVTVNNFMNLAQEGFYDGVTFHRVIKDFMIQGGDPLSKNVDDRSQHGTGGPEYRFGDEFNDERIVRGSLAMANAGPATNGSQFFIVTAEATPHLDGRHTNFGFVVDGMDVVDLIENVETDMRDNPVDPVIITSIELK